MSSNLSRMLINHPLLNATGGSGLYSDIELIYKNLGDHMPARYSAYAAVANSVTTVYQHDLGVDFNDITVVLYTGTYPALTRVDNPKAAGWNIQPTTSFLKTKIDVTTPSSGGPHDFSVFILQNPESILKAETLSNAQPTYVPSFVGQQRLDSVYGRLWVATGRSATTDWKRVNNSGFDIVVNSGVGLGTHTTLASALADFFDGARILIETSQTLNATIDVVNKVHMVCKPGVNIIKGTATTGISLNTGSAGAILENFRFQGFTTGGDKPLNISTGIANSKILFPVFASGQASDITEVDAGTNLILGQINE